MFLTVSCSGTYLFKEAVLAEKILLLSLLLLCVSSFLLAVDETSKVGLLAAVTLVEGGAMHGVLLRFSVIGVILIFKSFIRKNSLFLSVDESLLLNLLLQAKEWAELCSDRLGKTIKLDLLVASRASHEAERDLESGPLVLEKLDEAVGVEDMPA